MLTYTTEWHTFLSIEHFAERKRRWFLSPPKPADPIQSVNKKTAPGIIEISSLQQNTMEVKIWIKKMY